jgi:hypothetical protein
VAKRSITRRKSIKAIQRRRLAKVRALNEEFEVIEVKAVDSVKATEVVKPEPEAPKRKRLPKPKGGGAWILTPRNALKAGVEGIIEGYEWAAIKEIGNQYGVKDTSKVELCEEIIEEAQKIMDEMNG